VTGQERGEIRQVIKEIRELTETLGKLEELKQLEVAAEINRLLRYLEGRAGIEPKIEKKPLGFTDGNYLTDDQKEDAIKYALAILNNDSLMLSDLISCPVDRRIVGLRLRILEKYLPRYKTRYPDNAIVEKFFDADKEPQSEPQSNVIDVSNLWRPKGQKGGNEE